MKKSNRGKRRGIKALFCFILAAELIFGELGSSARAEGTNLENFDGEEIDAPGDVAGETNGGEEEKPEVPEGGGEEKPDAPEGGEEEKPDVPEGGEEEKPDVPEGGEEEKPDVPEGGGEEKPEVPEGGGEDEGSDVPEEGAGDVILELPAECICETLCTEAELNAECPVCAEDYLLCLGEEEEEAEEEELYLQSSTFANKGSYFEYEDEVAKIQFYVINDNPKEVQVHHIDFKEEDIPFYELPGTVTDKKGEAYSVVSISCGFGTVTTKLRSLVLPDCVRSIGDSLAGKLWLETVHLPESLEEIESRAFYRCSSLKEIKIPNGVKEIGSEAFNGCSSLKEIKIPNGVSKLGDLDFYECTALETVEVGANFQRFGFRTFGSCYSLKTLRIAVNLDESGNAVPIQAGDLTFSDSYASRQIIFLTPDGSAPYPAEGVDGGPRLMDISREYDKVDSIENAKWFGWQLPGGFSVKVNFSVHRDGKTWENHGKTFVLRINAIGGGYLPADAAVTEDGVYDIYEDTLVEGNDRYRKVGRKVTVHVLDSPEVTVEEPINYYTVTFYDGDEAYGEDTPQAPQIVLEGYKALYPEKPEKEGYSFDKWADQKNGAGEFSFSRLISSKTDVYATWKDKEPDYYKVTLDVQLNGETWSGCPKRFALKKKGESDYIKNFSRVTDGTYEIYEEIYNNYGAVKYRRNINRDFDVAGESKTVTLSYLDIACRAGEHGTIKLGGESPVLEGSDINYEVSPDGGYCIESLVVDGEEIEEAVGQTSYGGSLKDVRKVRTIVATFTEAVSKHELRVKIRLDDGTWIQNSKKFFARKQNQGKFMELDYDKITYDHAIMLPDGTYRIWESLRPNEDFDPVNNLQYMDDTRIDVTLNGDDASVDLEYYTTVLIAGDKVTLPESPIYIRKNSSVFIEIVPDVDCVISSVKLDDVEIGEERLAEIRKRWGFSMSPEETVEIHRIEVNCKPKNVMVQIYKNFVLWEDRETTIRFWNVNENEYSEEYSTRGDGIINAYLEPGKYVIYDCVQTGDRVEWKNTGITFEANSDRMELVTLPYFTVNAWAGNGGSISPNGESIVLQGSDCTFQIRAEEGNSLKELTVDGESVVSEVTEAGIYRLENIQSPKSVRAVFEGSTVPDVTYDVTVTVNKDKIPWGTENDKAYAFKEREGDTYTESYTVDAEGKFKTKLKNGTYGIYEAANTAARAIEYRDTKVEVKVDSKAAEAALDYYTVIFCDGADEYAAGTDQHPQVVLKDENAVQPQSPTKAGYSFNGWKTEEGGNVDFDFQNLKIADTTRIYASWLDGEKPVHTITALAGEGGTIDANGTVTVTEGMSQTFHIKAYEGYQIKSVLVDGVEMGALPTYCFSNVTGDHKIEVSFEKIQTGGGDEDPDKPGGGDKDPDKPGGGDKDPDKPGGGDEDSDKPGGGDKDPDKPGGGDKDPDKPSGGDKDPGKPGGGDKDSDKPGDGTGSDNLDGGNQGIIVGIDGNVVSATAQENANRNTVLQTSAGESGASANKNGASAGRNGTAALNRAADGENVSYTGEPKTGDAARYEVYAVIAMIVGTVYLLLFFLDSVTRMTEDEKNRRVAYLIGWGRRGRATVVRRCAAIIAIFFLLVYYYVLGRCMDAEERTGLTAA